MKSPEFVRLSFLRIIHNSLLNLETSPSKVLLFYG
ncbi:MAG: hypothetical protein ACI9Q4_001968 [Sediminicola sp.]|jgi:hypothetical protein